MQIYKHSLRKYVRSWSTWIILGIAVIIAFFLAGMLPYRLINPEKTSKESYTFTMLASISGSTAFLATFASVFGGFKSATMYKDEVEDGTFLIMLSKPQSRTKIILYKWLALQTINAGFAFIVAFAYMMAQYAFDNGNKIEAIRGQFTTMRDSAFVISSVIFGVIFVATLIFSAIGLLISTKTSVGATIGVATALGVVIPITSLIGTFSKSPAYQRIESNDLSVFQNTFDYYSRALESFSNADTNNQLPPTFKQAVTDLSENYVTVDSILKDSKTNMNKIGISTGNSKDSYQTLWVFDLNFHFTQLAAFASDKFTEDIDTSVLTGIAAASRSSGAPGANSYTVAKDTNNSFTKLTTFNDKSKELGKRLGTMASQLLSLDEKIQEVVSQLDIILSGIPSEAQANIEPLLKSLKEYNVLLKNPISFILNSEKISSSLSEFNLTMLPESSNVEDLIVDENNTKVLVSNEDIRIFNRLVSLIQEDSNKPNKNINNINGIYDKKYVSKWTVLSIYILISLVLVPLAYFIVKKQDFR